MSVITNVVGQSLCKIKVGGFRLESYGGAGIWLKQVKTTIVMLDNLIRGLHIISIICLVLVALLCGPFEFKFEWLYLAADVLQLVFLAFVLPFFAGKPKYSGTLLSGNFLPLIPTWPVWMFWVSLQATAFYVASALRGIFEWKIDYTAVRALLIITWVVLIYSGKISQWRSQNLGNESNGITH